MASRASGIEMSVAGLRRRHGAPVDRNVSTFQYAGIIEAGQADDLGHFHRVPATPPSNVAPESFFSRCKLSTTRWLLAFPDRCKRLLQAGWLWLLAYSPLLLILMLPIVRTCQPPWWRFLAHVVINLLGFVLGAGMLLYLGSNFVDGIKSMGDEPLSHVKDPGVKVPWLVIVVTNCETIFYCLLGGLDVVASWLRGTTILQSVTQWRQESAARRVSRSLNVVSGAGMGFLVVHTIIQTYASTRYAVNVPPTNLSVPFIHWPVSEKHMIIILTPIIPLVDVLSTCSAGCFVGIIMHFQATWVQPLVRKLTQLKRDLDPGRPFVPQTIYATVQDCYQHERKLGPIFQEIHRVWSFVLAAWLLLDWLIVLAYLGHSFTENFTDARTTAIFWANAAHYAVHFLLVTYAALQPLQMGVEIAQLWKDIEELAFNILFAPSAIHDPQTRQDIARLICAAVSYSKERSYYFVLLGLVQLTSARAFAFVTLTGSAYGVLYSMSQEQSGGSAIDKRNATMSAV
ncbi:uncharacterized protein LOC129592804 [Paramacrobiotus metropolitanus]|uniref:uncharacterized protein LOC129592804 n=1 Tax=Paramacrobiotus metropolitanus TaxID=2943436 RepID=UPI002445E8DA|nr:uncharacterized protein LOC129592804 [Paramacrobiotus metropolitanus]